MLDPLSEVIQYRYNQNELTKEEYQREFLIVLTARSRLGSPGDGDYNIQVPCSLMKGMVPTDYLWGLA